jgi:hypothetical protein
MIKLIFLYSIIIKICVLFELLTQSNFKLEVSKIHRQHKIQENQTTTSYHHHQ